MEEQELPSILLDQIHQQATKRANIESLEVKGIADCYFVLGAKWMASKELPDSFRLLVERDKEIASLKKEKEILQRIINYKNDREFENLPQ